MKILVVSHYFWPESFKINDLCLGLRQDGHEITVLTGLPNYPDGDFFKGYGYFKNYTDSYNGINVLRVPLIKRKKAGAIRLVLNYLSFAISASLIAPFRLRNQKFDIVFSFVPSPVTSIFPAIVIKWIKKIPLYIWIQDVWPDSLAASGVVKNKRILNATGHITSFIYKHSDRILVQSKAFEKCVTDWGGNKDKIYYYPNTAEDLYKSVTVSSNDKRRLLFPSGFNVLFAGNIGSLQDFETILLAAKKTEEYPEINWLIVGNGRKKGWVEEKIIELGLVSKVKLLGGYAMEEMPYFFALADVMLATLIKDTGLAMVIPSKLQSYLACGKPIVAALDGEGANLIKEANCGFVCNTSEPIELAQLVIKMYETPLEQRLEMGNNGKKYFDEHFNRVMLINKLSTWVKEAITKN